METNIIRTLLKYLENEKLTDAKVLVNYKEQENEASKLTRHYNSKKKK